jgi:glyoxylase-like metal-dependent hydrolase (beta-lactamase superfamily II)
MKARLWRSNREPGADAGATLTPALDRRMNAGMLLQPFVTGPLETNAYLVADRDSGEALVIDPGATGNPGLSRAGAVDVPAHRQHPRPLTTSAATAPSRSATGASCSCTRRMSPMLSEAVTHARFFMMRAENSPPPDLLLEDRGEVRVGAVVLRVMHTPGHSPGGVTLVAPGVAFCGDLVFHGSVGRTDLPGGSERVLLDSIRRHIMTLPDDTVLYPGHGPDTTVGLEKRQNHFFRLARR